MNGSELATGTGSGEGEATAGVSLNDLPDRPESVDVEETVGNKTCILRYTYPAQKGDQVSWTLDIVETGESEYLFEVKRLNSDRVVYRHRSRHIPASVNIKNNLVCKKEQLLINKGCYEIKLEKKTDFRLDTYFRPDSP